MAWHLRVLLARMDLLEKAGIQTRIQRKIMAEVAVHWVMVQFPVIVVIPKVTGYQLVMAAEVHIRHGVELTKLKCKTAETVL